MQGLLLAVLLTIGLTLFLMPKKVSAHCDTYDGPTATDARKSLETGNINYALKWIFPENEEELKKIFELSRNVRVLSPEAQELADQYFQESLIRIHRAGEGAPFDGMKPSGVPIDPRVAAADKSLEVGNLSPLEGVLPKKEVEALEGKFQRALKLKNYDTNDLDAAREYIEAYVIFFKTAEGEMDEHGHGEHGHNEHAHQH
ncbi:MAG: DUF6448 family protein [Clostridiaceae bacterium]